MDVHMKTRGIIALDGMTPLQAYSLAERLAGKVLGFKVNDLLDADRSPGETIRRLKDCGPKGTIKVFADIKAHDIPATVSNRVKQYAMHGADLVSVHASAGLEALQKAVETYHAYRSEGLGILAITVLTSLSDDDCYSTYGALTPFVAVKRFVDWAEKAGAYGFICSPKELVDLQGKYIKLKRVTPGVRSLGAKTHDQSRFDTPAHAVAN